ncbi:hypothetical protein LBMAG56_14040 [Verrucomicrobiota bacterium]|nr:hypothetical protein LBMAG56_14040 [Verrucomicrobiota bacterium]
MKVTGIVEDGIVRLPADWKDGTAVQVETLPLEAGNELTRRLLKIAGEVDGLPSDLAAQHNHYLYSTPKR